MKFRIAAAVLACALLLGAKAPPGQTIQNFSSLFRQAAKIGEQALKKAAAENARAARRAAKERSPFQDVKPGQWYTKAVSALAARGVLEVPEDGLFHPQEPVSRVQLLQMLAALSEADTAAREDRNTFSDVPQDAWYAPYVRWAAREKLLRDGGGASFGPEDAVSRQEMAVLLYRFNQNVMGKRFPEGENRTFEDSSSIESWAEVEVSAVERAGLMSGYRDGNFRPEKTVTRAETAQILYRYSLESHGYEQGCTIEELRRIPHGGGSVEGGFYTSNSLDALQETYNWGNRIVELDFSWTSDGELACLHNWGGTFPEKSTLQDFLTAKTYGRLTTMGLEQLAEWMRDHPDARIVMDIKGNVIRGLKMIAEGYPDLVDRFYPYLYDTEDYEPIRALGYRNFILFTARIPIAQRDYTALAEFAREKGLIGIAINAYSESGIYAPAMKAGVPVLAYTVDSEAWMQQLARQGADGFVTNLQDALIEW